MAVERPITDIVVIDPDPDTREPLALKLTWDGFTVVEIPTLYEGLEWLQTKNSQEVAAVISCKTPGYYEKRFWEDIEKKGIKVGLVGLICEQINDDSVEFSRRNRVCFLIRREADALVGDLIEDFIDNPPDNLVVVDEKDPETKYSHYLNGKPVRKGIPLNDETMGYCFKEISEKHQRFQESLAQRDANPSIV